MLKYSHANQGAGLKIYVSGKITGLDYHETFAKFEKGEELLKAMFPLAEIVNPLKLHPPEMQNTQSWEWFMLSDIEALLPCDMIALLHDWKDSKGARIEHTIAAEMNKQILFLHGLS